MILRWELSHNVPLNEHRDTNADLKDTCQSRHNNQAIRMLICLEKSTTILPIYSVGTLRFLSALFGKALILRTEWSYQHFDHWLSQLFPNRVPQRAASANSKSSSTSDSIRQRPLVDIRARRGSSHCSIIKLINQARRLVEYRRLSRR